MTGTTRLGTLALAAAAALMLATTAARAAPQVLALLATEGPLEMACDGARCVAEMPSLCLQPERRAPEAGRAYRVIDTGALRLVGRAADGTARALELPPEARFVALRTHVAVALEVPAAWIGANFAALDGVAVAGLAVLKPLPAAGDVAPLRGAELAAVRAERAPVADGVLAAAPESVAAIRLSARLINLLAAGGRTDEAALAAAWNVVGGPEIASALARFHYDFCRFGAANNLFASARACLQAQHDKALEDLYSDYVAVLNAGS